MEIIEVRFTRKFNLGNYETMDIGLVATVAKNESEMEVISRLDKYTQQYATKRKEATNGR